MAIKKTYPVTGMSCASCAVSVESILKTQPGVFVAEVNFAASTVLVEYDAKKITETALQNAVREIGYDMITDPTGNAVNLLEEVQQKHFKELKQRTYAAVLLCIPIIVVGMFFMHRSFAGIVLFILSTPVVFVFGRQFFMNAIKQLKHKSANMDTLVALSTGIAYIFSIFNLLFPEYWHKRGLHADVYFETAAVVITFILTGRLLEERAKFQTSVAIKKLMQLQPGTVTLILADGTEKVVAVSSIKKGDTVLVKPGERIPVDGIIQTGNSSIDESTITGESIPSEKKSGDLVLAGTLNQNGTFKFIAQKVGEATLLSRIIQLVQQAQGSKAPVQQKVDKIAAVFVPVIIGISFLTFVFWILSDVPNSFSYALMAMTTVLVIACPCALGLATPTAIMVGIGKGAELGILIKNAESLERIQQVNTLVLDKTGTLTVGQPTVNELLWLEKENQETLKSILYTIEKKSEHPLAAAVYHHLGNCEQVEQEDFINFPGKGIKAMYENTAYYVGNQKLLLENNVPVNSQQQETIDSFIKTAQTVVLFANQHKLLAIITISDPLKETTAEAIQQLLAKGIEIYLVTGDHKQTAAAIAQQVGITQFKAGVLPDEKAHFIRELQSNGKIVAMAGDGVNDAPALAQADVSIAMGKGSDIAMETAQMTLLSSDLMLLPKAIALSKQTVKVVHQNLFWAFIYNIIGIPIAAGILYPVNGFLLNPMIAGAAMALSSISVVSNSLLLKFRKI